MAADDDVAGAGHEAPQFRYPPNQITHGCAAYMERVQELRDFLSAFFTMVKSLGYLTEIAAGIASETLETHKHKTMRVHYQYSAHQQFLAEIVLSRTIETFNLYVLTTLRAIFRARPEMLISESPIAVATIIERRNFEDILTYVAERRLHELSFKPLSELNKFIDSRTGIPLFASPDAYRTALIASEVRNLVAHNDCLVNDLFRHRVRDALPQLDIPAHGRFNISDQWMREVCYILDGIVFDFDRQVSDKFDLPTIDGKRFQGNRPGTDASLQAFRFVL